MRGLVLLGAMIGAQPSFILLTLNFLLIEDKSKSRSESNQIRSSLSLIPSKTAKYARFWEDEGLHSAVLYSFNVRENRGRCLCLLLYIFIRSESEQRWLVSFDLYNKLDLIWWRHHQFMRSSPQQSNNDVLLFSLLPAHNNNLEPLTLSWQQWECIKFTQ